MKVGKGKEKMMSGMLETPEKVLEFALAGNATFTLKSKISGLHMTYRIRKPGDESPHFVALMSGPDNEGSYQYLGTIFSGKVYKHGAKSRISLEAPSEKVFNQFWAAISQNRIPAYLEVWHEGKCGRCGRKLTVPESIATGIGPICDGRI